MSSTPSPASTLACGGAPASVKPGVGPTAALGGTALTALLTAFGAEEAALIFDVILAGVNWDITNICTSGDPGPVTLTLQDYADALNTTDLLHSVPAINKFHQWIAHAMFPQWCQCSDGSVPGPATPPLPPPYLPNPGAPSGAVVSPCWDVKATVAPTNYQDLSALFLPVTQRVTTNNPQTGVPNYAFLIPSGISNWTCTTTYHSTQAPIPNPPAGTLEMYDSGNNFQTSAILWNYTGMSPPYATQTRSASVGTGHSWIFMSDYGLVVPDTLEVEFSFFCSGQSPTTLSVPCCPPDPSVDIRLRSIQDMLQFLMDQTKPAYKTGTVHTGITGAGTIPIADLIGVKIEITSGIPTNPELPGTPPYEFSVGWMSVSEPNGMLDEKRITRQHQVWLSGVTPYATVFGYYLNPGFTINVTELIPQ